MVRIDTWPEIFNFKQVLYVRKKSEKNIKKSKKENKKRGKGTQAIEK